MKSIQPLAILVITAVSFSAFSQVRKYSNAFLDIGAGARGLSLASAQVATVGDATSGYWNPAALTRVKNNVNLSLMHAEYFAGIAKYDVGAFAIPLKDRKSFIGFSMLRFAVDDIPNTLELFEPDGSINYDNIQSFSVADWAFIFSFAQKFQKAEGLSLGGNAKIIYRNAGDFATAWGFGLDFSASYQLKQWRFGVMGRDVTSTFNAWSFNFTEEEKEVLVTTGNIIPENSLEVTVPKFIFAAAYEVNIKDKFGILPELDFEMTTDGKRNVPIRTNAVSFDPRFGLELNYSDIIYLRGGIGNIQKSTDDAGEKIITFQPSIGIGLQIKTFGLDYAFTDIGNQSDALYSHVFSLHIGINKKKQQ
ncbi:MAG TPA: PorV/PorQ family protein [Chitinophagales bacterium]|nr:PorV/PorQ family protein [Chitinophagales bacterium]